MPVSKRENFKLGHYPEFYPSRSKPNLDKSDGMLKAT